MKLSLPLATFPAASAFLRAYAGDFNRVAGWFHYNPHDPACFTQRMAELDSMPASDRAPLAQAALEQQQRWGSGPQALAAAALLGEPGVYTVVTGQQVGLFGGPLYTQLKAVNAVLLARRLSELFPGRRFVPTFWMGTSDSDYDEVRLAHYLDREGHLAEIALPPAPADDDAKLVSAREVGPQLQEALLQLEQSLSGGEYREEALSALKQAYSAPPGASVYDSGLAGGFARWMAHLFHDTELVLLDPQDPALMRAAIPLIERDLTSSATIEEALLSRNAAISAAGFTLQVEHMPGDTSLFLLDAGQRRRKLSRDADGFVLRPTGEHFSLAELLAIAHSTPERFVPGVMLRPIYQNTLFPPAAFIGGGAELSYRAQTAAVFDCHHQRMAPALFRQSATLLPAKQAAVLDELGLELTDCYCLPQDLAARAVAQTRPEDIDAALSLYRERIFSADHDLEAAAVRLDPALGETFTTLRGNLERHVEKLEKKITSALKQRHETLVRRVSAVHSQVYPQLALQERVLGLYGFLPRYGASVLQLLMEQLEAVGWDHRILILG